MISVALLLFPGLGLALLGCKTGHLVKYSDTIFTKMCVF